MASQSFLGKILIVDDDKAVTDLLCLNLHSEGYDVQVVRKTFGISAQDIRDVHLVLIDGANQKPSGIELISTLKSMPAGRNVGFIYYAAYDSERTLIEALDAGADDSVCKPFSLREMMARVRAVMRRRAHIVTAQTSQTVLTVGDMTVDTVQKTVSVSEERISLSGTEYAILELLLHNANTYTSRIEIFRKIWPDGANERIVDTNISRLRRKLGAQGSCIVNRTGLGYMISLD